MNNSPWKSGIFFWGTPMQHSKLLTDIVCWWSEKYVLLTFLYLNVPFFLKYQLLCNFGSHTWKLFDLPVDWNFFSINLFWKITHHWKKQPICSHIFIHFFFIIFMISFFFQMQLSLLLFAFAFAVDGVVSINIF